MAFQALNASSANTNSNPAVAHVAGAAYPHRGVALSAVDEAFGPRPELQAAIRRVLGTSERPEHYELFEGIARYVLQLQSAATAAAAQRDELDDRLTKRRKLDGDTIVVSNTTAATKGASVSNGAAAPTASAGGVTAAAAAAAAAAKTKTKTEQFDSYSGQRFEGLSFTAPQRKKLTLEIGAATDQGLRAIGAEGRTEFGIPYNELEYIFKLPVPEKPTAQHVFCAFPRDALTANTADEASHEPMVWTTADTRPKGADAATPTPSDTMHAALRAAQCPLMEPSEDEFASAIPQPHRKGEKAFHVKGFRGSKDGYLFFLTPGIVWGFKKPLMFFPYSSIASVSYTAVLQRTFNLVVATNSSGANGADEAEGGGEEIEFQLLDQADFGGIDEYVKRHRLNDASMAEARKAKRLNINGPARRGGAADGEGGEGQPGAAAGAGGEGDESELAKAQREAEAQGPQDSEDDEEDDENFDPGSDDDDEGESGSGDSGSSDGDGEGGDDDDDDDDDDDE